MKIKTIFLLISLLLISYSHSTEIIEDHINDTDGEGDFQEEDSRTYYEKKLDSIKYIEIHNKTQLEEYITKNDKNIILFLGNLESKAFQKFRKLNYRNLHMLYTSNNEILQEYSVPSDSYELILFKISGKTNKIKNGRALKIQTDKKHLQIMKSKITHFSKPKVRILNDDILTKIIQYGYPSLIITLLNSDDTKLTEKSKEILRNLSKKYRGDIGLYIAYYQDESNSMYLKKALGINPVALPQVVILDGINSNHISRVRKFKHSNNTAIEESLIENFVEDFKNNKLEQYLVSQPIPEKQNENGVFKLVAKNFESFFNNNIDKDIAILFCLEGESECEKASHIWAAISKKFSNNKNLILSEIDGIKNNVETLFVNYFPTVIFFPKSQKRIKSRIVFDKIFKFETVVEFLLNNTKTTNDSLITLDDELEYLKPEEKNLVRKLVLDYEGHISYFKEPKQKPIKNLTEEFLKHELEYEKIRDQLKSEEDEILKSLNEDKEEEENEERELRESEIDENHFEIMEEDKPIQSEIKQEL